VADVVRQHRSEHARTLLETACQEAAQLTDYLPVFKRFLYQPTWGSTKTPESSTGNHGVNGFHHPRPM